MVVIERILRYGGGDSSNTRAVVRSLMMFSDEDIRRAINDGSLVVKPFQAGCIKAASLALHLGDSLLRPRPGKVVDILKKILPDYDKIQITNGQPYLFNPGDFVLGHTYEAITVGPQIGFLIEGRSTLARLGLTVVQTAMMVLPGHRDRTVTLELANHGPNPILLYPKMRIARAAIFELKSPCKIQYDDHGKYRGQNLVGVPIFDKEFLEEEIESA